MKRLGNPILVVFVSWVVLGRTREILREVRPDDMAEDMDLRADEGRERRGELGDGQDDTEDVNDAGATRESDAIGFEYLTRHSASIHDVAYLMERGQLDDRDVRVRVDEVPVPLR